MHKALAAETGNLMLRVNPEVAKVLKSNQNVYTAAGRSKRSFAALRDRPSDPLLHQTKFDLA